MAEQEFICACTRGGRDTSRKIFQMKNSQIQGEIEQFMGELGEYDYYLQMMTEEELKNVSLVGINVTAFDVVHIGDKNRFMI